MELFQTKCDENTFVSNTFDSIVHESRIHHILQKHST